METDIARMIRAASAAIKMLEPPKGRSSKRRELINGVMSEMLAARKKGITHKALAKAISETTGERVTSTLVKKCIDEYNLDIDARAKQIGAMIGAQKK